MRILVTGGAGFIGSNLVKALLKEGHKVTVFDNLSTGRAENLEQTNPVVIYYFYDLLDSNCQSLLDAVVRRSDVIFHLAAVVGVKEVMHSSVNIIKVNHHTTERVLELACKYRKRVVFTSSSEVYGINNTEPLVETQPLIIQDVQKKRHSYACSKMLNEFMALGYYKEMGLNVTIARLFNTVGFNQLSAYGMVLPTFVSCVKRGIPIPVHGDGSQRRSFIHVDDTVRALIMLAEKTNTAGEIFNVGNPLNEISINDLAHYVGYYSNKKYITEKIPYHKVYDINEFDDIQRRVPDIDKIKVYTGWKPKHGLFKIVQDALRQGGGDDA